MLNVKKQIFTLIEIQNINKKRQELISQINDITLKIASIKSTVEKYEQELKAEQSMISSFENKYRKTENNYDDCTSKIAISKNKLSKVKSNKEYKSTLKEIDALSNNKSSIENIMLQYLEKIETKKISIAKKLRLLLIRREKLAGEKTTLLDKQLHMNLEVTHLNKKIKSIRTFVDTDILTTFDNIAKKITGAPPIAPVCKSICMGCNMSVPAQLSNELQKFDKIRFCPYCKRIAYWDNQDKK